MSNFDPLQEVRRHDPVFRSPTLRRGERKDARAARNKIIGSFVFALLLAMPAFTGLRYALQHPEEFRGWVSQTTAIVQGKIQVIVGRTVS
jgi:hypothetical protein